MPSLKPSLPFGQLPVLEVDGNTICQSMAIARYLASECGIAGSSGLVKAQVDEVVDVVNDVQNAMVSPSVFIVSNVIYNLAKYLCFKYAS